MDINVNGNLLKKLPGYKENKEAFDEKFREHYRYNSGADFFAIDIDELEDRDLKALQTEAEKLGGKEGRALSRKINLHYEMQTNAKDAKVARLEVLEAAAKAVIGKLPNKWLFAEQADGTFLPYYVSNIKYHPFDRRDQAPAHVKIEMDFVHRGESRERYLRYGSEDVDGKTVIEIFRESGFCLETPKLVESYYESVERYKEIHNLTGHQFSAVGKATVVDGYWGRGTTEMEREGSATRVVMDDAGRAEEEEHRSSRKGGKSLAVSTEYWDGKSKVSEEEDGGTVIPPLHPYVEVFDLTKHEYVSIHVDNLTEYKYDVTVGEKLILPRTTKLLVDILVTGASSLMDDIIKGKTGGIIVLATGQPGTGKTLTAEVYSETVKKPLYVVQCSQLGTDSESLEKNLTQVLARASRWGAILLIDEADVYVRERGADIDQNAIVGVFLRVLEYYRGVLFMTSNRATIIDDAILSRATAHLRYEIPNQEEAEQIWTVLAKQFKIKTEESIGEISKAFPEVSGRTIKNLLKLSKLIADKEKKPITLKLVKYASQFLDGVRKEEGR